MIDADTLPDSSKKPARVAFPAPLRGIRRVRKAQNLLFDLRHYVANMKPPYSAAKLNKVFDAVVVISELIDNYLEEDAGTKRA